MPNIIRCPACRTFVYETARRCHACDQEVGKRRLLTGWSWAFIGVVLAGFIVARSVDLIQDAERRDSIAVRQREEAVRQREELRTARRFVEAWVAGEDSTVRDLLAPNDGSMVKSLREARDAYPNVFPATVTEMLRHRLLDVYGSSSTGRPPKFRSSVFNLAAPRGARSPSHASVRIDAVQAGPEGNEADDGPKEIVVSGSRRTNRTYYNATERVGGGYVSTTAWTESAVELEVVVLRDDERFRVFIGVHIDRDHVQTFRLARVEDFASGEPICPRVP